MYRMIFVSDNAGRHNLNYLNKSFLIFNNNPSRHLADKMGTSYLQKVLNQVRLVSVNMIYFFTSMTHSLAGDL